MREFSDLSRVLLPFAEWSFSLWFYTASHSELVLQLRHPSKCEVRYLVFDGCRDVCVPDLSKVGAISVRSNDELSWEVSTEGGVKLQAEVWRLVEEYAYPI